MSPIVLSAAAVTDVVLIAPGDNIQSIVDAHLPGTSYLLLPGLHRMQSAEPKDGDSFTGELGAVMSGAVRLGPFVRRSGQWLAAAPKASAAPTGKCAKDQNDERTDICTYLEDLFLDSRPLRRVAERSEVGTGAWYFDYDKNLVVMADNPRGRLVEISVLRRAFRGTARNVIISGLIIEKYASPAQSGAIQGADSAAWTVRHNEIRFNHGAVRTAAQ